MPSPTRSDRRRPDRGQAAVELALAMPLVCVVLLGVVQVAVIVRDQLVVQAAARDGARAAAAAADPASAAAVASAAVASRAGPLDVAVSTSTSGGRVTVIVRHTDPTDVPLIGALLPDAEVEATATMVLEPP